MVIEFENTENFPFNEPVRMVIGKLFKVKLWNHKYAYNQYTDEDK